MKPGDALCCQLMLHEQGSSLLELALVLPIFLVLMAGAVNFGRAYYALIEVASAADAGAAYGLANMTDTAGMSSAAALDAKDVNGLNATSTWGCECSDGSAASDSCLGTPSCPVNVVYYVDVQTSLTLKSILVFPGIPSSLALTGHSRMRVAP